MKVLIRELMPDGTHIQIEDWSNDYDFISYGETLVAYPISKYHCDGAFSPKVGQTFRCVFYFKNNKLAMEALNALKNGEKTLKDYKEYLKNPKYAICL